MKPIGNEDEVGDQYTNVHVADLFVRFFEPGVPSKLGYNIQYLRRAAYPAHIGLFRQGQGDPNIASLMT